MNPCPQNHNHPSQNQSPNMSFPPLHILPPLSPNHTHTLILLHGRGSTGPEFAEELLVLTGRTSTSSPSSPSPTLRSHIPTFRLVFPTAPTRYSATFEESFPAWFNVEGLSLTELERGREMQVLGLRECVRYLGGVVRGEVSMLAGRRDRVWVAGVSMGMAVGLWTVLKEGGGVGGFVGMCGWLPFAGGLEGVVTEGGKDAVMRVAGFIRDTLALDDDDDDGTIEQPDTETQTTSLLSTPILLLHGTDDAFVDVELGRGAARVLRQIGFDVESKEYVGAENEGHWVKEPEGFDDIVAFISKHASMPAS